MLTIEIPATLEEKMQIFCALQESDFVFQKKVFGDVILCVKFGDNGLMKSFGYDRNFVLKLHNCFVG